MPMPSSTVEMIKMAAKGGGRDTTNAAKKETLPILDNGDAERGRASQSLDAGGWGQESMDELRPLDHPNSAGKRRQGNNMTMSDMTAVGMTARRKACLCAVLVAVVVIAAGLGVACSGGRCSADSTHRLPSSAEDSLSQKSTSLSPSPSPSPSLAPAPALVEAPKEFATKALVYLQAERAPRSTQLDAELTYTVVKTLPHDSEAFTQGLEYLPGTQTFVESTGRYGHSTIRKVDIATGGVQVSTPITDNRVFGEGCTVVRNVVYQITWMTGRCYTYDLATLARRGDFSYEGQGWGITHNEQEELVMSDGSQKIVFRDPATFAIKRSILVHDMSTGSSTPVTNINELEWVRGEILANIWHAYKVARIRPSDGLLLGWIDFTGVNPAVNQATWGDSVLNGIAWDQEEDRLWVTGKMWSKLYEVELRRK